MPTVGGAAGLLELGVGEVSVARGSLVWLPHPAARATTTTSVAAVESDLRSAVMAM